MTKTYVSRAAGLTAVWYNGRVISAWMDSTGDSENPHAAYALTKDPNGPAPSVPDYHDGGADNCPHGISPARLCMLCGSNLNDNPAGA